MLVSENIMFVSLNFGLPPQSCNVAADADIDPRRLKASAALYSGKAFAAIKSDASDIRAQLLRKAIKVPSAFSATYILPAEMTSDVQDYLERRAESRRDLVAKFVANDYAAERDQARIDLNGSFREKDFPPPSAIADYFSMRWSIFTLEIPQGLPAELRDAEIAKYRENMETVFAECRTVLRATLAKLVSHLADKLKPDADGRRKILYATAVDNLTDFLDTINARDITSDAEIREISDQARRILAPYSLDDLKTAGYAATVQTELADVKQSIDNLITRDGARKIDLDLD